MSNLTPEPRVNKNGITVIKYVRPDQRTQKQGLLSRLIPALTGSHKAEQAQQHAQLLSAIEENIYSNSNDLESIEYLASRLKHMKTSTLAKIEDVLGGSDKMGTFLTKGPYNESELRVALNFPDRKWNTVCTERIIKDVSAVMEIRKLDEIDPASDNHAVANLLIQTANDIYMKRLELNTAKNGLTDYDDSSRDRGWDITQMTSDIAFTVMNNPDRVEDIAEYIASRELKLEDVDTEHLRLYLSAPPALAEGAL